MTEFEKFIQINPGYPECKNCYLVEDLIKKSENYHLFSEPNTHNLQLDKGVLRMICHKNVIGEPQMTIIKTFPKINQNGGSNHFAESSRVNLTRISPAINNPKTKTVEAKAEKI